MLCRGLSVGDGRCIPPPPNHRLWCFSMLPQYDPTGTLEPWLCLNGTSNPHIARWIILCVDKEDGAHEIVRALGHRYNLIPHVLNACDQMRWEGDFEHPALPRHRKDVEFLTQMNMHPERFLQRRRRKLSWTYSIVWTALSGIGP